VLLLAGLLALMLTWQASLQARSASLDRSHRMNAATGMCYSAWARFFYFYYYFDAFPLSVRPPPKGYRYTQEAAQRLLHRRGADLVMADDSNCAVGLVGEYARIALFLPGAWLRGDPRAPTIAPVTVGFFLLALGAFLVAAARLGELPLGVAVVGLVGSHAFQVHEVYASRNVFSLPISAAILALAMHLRLLRTPVRAAPWDWGVALATGVLFGTLREIRMEAAVTLVSAIVVYLLARPLGWPRRLGLAATALAAFTVTGAAWSRHYDVAYENSARLVREHGGALYPGPRDLHHPVWHSLWCGLGDFGGDRGYVFTDGIAYRYATPILNSKYGYHFEYRQGGFFENAYDERGLYKILPVHVPEYTVVIRKAFLDEVLGSPGWYAGILGRRLLHILNEPTPTQLHAVWATVPLPWSGWLVLPVLVLLALRRDRFLLGVLLFTLPLSALPLLVMAGAGTTYGAVFPQISLAIVLALAWREGARRWRARPGAASAGFRA
jgi:hypothetical protein